VPELSQKGVLIVVAAARHSPALFVEVGISQKETDMRRSVLRYNAGLCGSPLRFHFI